MEQSFVNSGINHHLGQWGDSEKDTFKLVAEPGPWADVKFPTTSSAVSTPAQASQLPPREGEGSPAVNSMWWGESYSSVVERKLNIPSTSIKTNQPTNLIPPTPAKEKENREGKFLKKERNHDLSKRG